LAEETETAVTFAPGPRFQVEYWEEGRMAFLAVAAQLGVARAWFVAHDARTWTWTGACVPIAPDPSHHDLRALARRVPLHPLTSGDLVGVGLLEWGAQGAARRLAATVIEGGDIHEAHRSESPWLDLFPRIDDLLPGRNSRGPDPEAYGFPGTKATRRVALASGRPAQTLVAPALPGSECATFTLPDNRRPGMDKALAKHLDPALSRLLSRFETRVSDVLDRLHWTPDSHRFYAPPDTLGERRRQAARLHPALAPLLASTRAIRQAIDAGRPHEPALLARVNDLLDGHGHPPIGPATLRRLRTLTPGLSLDVTVRTIAAAGRIPVDWIPRDEEGWTILIRQVLPAMRLVNRLGLDLTDVVSHAKGDWPLLTRPDPRLMSDFRLLNGYDDPTLSTALSGAMDVARRLRQSLLGPILSVRGRTEADAVGDRVAGTILFGGRTFPSIVRLSKRWHAGLPALDAALPSPGSGNIWPALAPPFRTRGDIEIAFLTDESQLKAEGWRGTAPDGTEGLAHCVGGYGKACFTGGAHVASVRRLRPDGFDRLSTVQFLVAEPSEDDRAPGIYVQQHLGLRNREPEEIASAAVGDFLAAAVTGLHPVSPDAARVRSDEGYLESYDPRAPGNLERAFDAWAPYLPRAIARGGLDILTGRVLELVDGLGPPPPYEGPHIEVTLAP
jgi:hypothetical protein